MADAVLQRCVDVEPNRRVGINGSEHAGLGRRSEPALGGDWTTTWFSNVSMSNKVVPVFGLRSLFVYAAPVKPVAAAHPRAVPRS